jgi:hypothetical protein
MAEGRRVSSYALFSGSIWRPWWRTTRVQQPLFCGRCWETKPRRFRSARHSPPPSMFSCLSEERGELLRLGVNFFRSTGRQQWRNSGLVGKLLAAMAMMQDPWETTGGAYSRIEKERRAIAGIFFCMWSKRSASKCLLHARFRGF